METGEGFDMLCPFGGNQVVLVNGAIVPGEEEETEEERDEGSPMPEPVSANADDSEAEMEPDLEDIAGEEDAANHKFTDGVPVPRKFEAWLSVGDAPGKPGKPQHKSTIL
jgi:hypothetical protein